MNETTLAETANQQQLRYQALVQRILADVNAGQSVTGAMQAAIRDGVPEADARATAAEVKKMIVGAYKKHALGRLGWGAFWLVLGVVVSAGTYLMASEHGGSYFVMWGALAFGAYRFIAGLFGYLSAGSNVE